MRCLGRELCPAFFHVKKGDEVAKDPEGIELADETAAHDEALQAAQGLLLAEAAIHGDDLQEEVFVIEDENGREAMTVPFSEAARPD